MSLIFKPPPIKSTTGVGGVSGGNSSTTPLTNGSTFTGDWEDVSAYGSVVVAVKTDQNGTFTVQFSPDGTNADSTLTRYYRTAQIEAPHRFTVTRRYFRVTFTNDSGSDQTYFRLQSVVGEKTELNAPTDSTLAQDFDAIVVRPTDFDHEVALGRRQGAFTTVKFGYNPDVDVGTETVWAVGGTFTPLSSASTLTVVSSDTADDGDPAGTGAQTLLVTGVDASRNIATEIVTMNGTTNVVTSGTWLGVNRVVVLAAGSSQANVGNITITATTGGTNQAYIPAGEGVTQQCVWFTPAGYNSAIDDITLNINKISGGGSPRVTVRGWAWNPGVTNSRYVLFRADIDTAVENTVYFPLKNPILLSPTDVFWLRATTDTNNTVVGARFSLVSYRQAAT